MKTKPHPATIPILVLIGIAWLSTACSVKGDIFDDSSAILSETFSPQTGIVAGSAQNQVVNGYRVSASLGAYMGGSQEIVNGYKVYQSVQGNMNSVTSETTY